VELSIDRSHFFVHFLIVRPTSPVDLDAIDFDAMIEF